MSFTLVGVTGRYVDPATGKPRVGTVTFTLTGGQLRNDTQLAGPSWTVSLNHEGAFTTKLPATDDPGTTPEGAVYVVTEDLGHGSAGSGYVLAVSRADAATGVRVPPASAPRPTVTGPKGGNAALASLMTALASLGLVTDSTT